MARARTIKPGFFANEILAECEPLARLLFAGLWQIADRNGRLENRPKRIKKDVLPYDDCDIPNLLLQLAAVGFIVCYTVGARQCIQITNFAKHQTPHPKELASDIPEPCSREAPIREEPVSQTIENTTPITAQPIHGSAVPKSGTAQPRSVLAQPSPVSLLPFPHSSKGSEANASAPGGARDSPLDLKRELWRIGKRFLDSQGVPDKQIGSLLGSWRRDFGDANVIQALAAAEAECASEPVEFIVACLQRQGNHDKRNRPASNQRPSYADVGAQIDAERAEARIRRS